MAVMTQPQITLELLAGSQSWFEETNMIIGMKIDGFNRLRRTLVRGSKQAYETKKMDKQALY